MDDPIKGVAYPQWDLDTDLEVMDRNGIQASIVSITAPGWVSRAARTQSGPLGPPTSTWLS
ncbi:hypothetical protein [Nocardioides sp. LS1]|uniref:hypothetical protein n=1 Tax=Nocardioides sp. LS1 TaxID=1027620 RepID=UPI001C8CA96A|nr:hypothetical protein [Nocardioides sp. LS1]